MLQPAMRSNWQVCDALPSSTTHRGSPHVAGWSAYPSIAVISISLPDRREGPRHKVAALQPAAREQEPRSRWLIERTAIAGGQGQHDRLASRPPTQYGQDQQIISGPAPGEPHRAQTSLLECAVHLGRKKLTRTMPLNTDRPINRAMVAGCAISATRNYLKLHRPRRLNPLFSNTRAKSLKLCTHSRPPLFEFPKSSTSYKSP
jgi:hypothetical protein